MAAGRCQERRKEQYTYERQEEENNDLQLSATFRFLQPHEGEWKI